MEGTWTGADKSDTGRSGVKPPPHGVFVPHGAAGASQHITASPKRTTHTRRHTHFIRGITADKVIKAPLYLAPEALFPSPWFSVLNYKTDVWVEMNLSLYCF